MRGQRRECGWHWWTLPILAGVAMSCRISPGDKPVWLEPHGHAEVKHVAAAPEGVYAVNGSGGIIRYPGPWGRPWYSGPAGKPVAMAASPAGLFVIDENGLLQKFVGGTGSPSKIADARHWKASAIAASETGQVAVIANGNARRVASGELVDTPCTAHAAVSIAFGGETLFVATTDGALMTATHDRCEPVSAPFKAKWVAAFRDRLAAISTGGVVYLSRQGQWDALPRAMVHRPDKMSRPSSGAAEVAMSETTLWMNDVDGFVFLLTDPR